MLFFLLIGFVLIGYGIVKATQEKISTSSDHIIQQNYKVKREILEDILDKVEYWETQNGFLDSRITQRSLAKTLNTNSAYLSKAINVYKKQNFASYLKGVRIAYAIDHLQQNPEMLKTKSMIQIAEMYGFNSLTVFTKAFKNKTGTTPGIFFRKMIEQEFRKNMQ